MKGILASTSLVVYLGAAAFSQTGPPQGNPPPDPQPIYRVTVVSRSLAAIVVAPSNKAKISVTTDLQALGLMVTAEPYYSVTAPSAVVVVENMVRPDTVGKVEEVAAKYDLLPRGQY